VQKVSKEKGANLNLEYKELNYSLFRIVMGLNMTIHGAVRIFGDYQSFISKMEMNFEPTLLPKVLVTIGANLISPTELLFGLFLILGFKTRLSISILTLNMMLLITGVCILEKWDLAGLQMSYVIYLFLLGHFIDLNNVSLDQLLLNKKKG